LPAGAAFIDLFRYTEFVRDPKTPGRKGATSTRRYVAFIVQPGRETARVELGETAPIEKAWSEWHAALTNGQPDREAAATLARLVWQPLRAKLPEKVGTVWLAPDAELTRVPWSALPGAEPNTILLEEHAVAVVPHGEFLLHRLKAASSKHDEGVLLAVGGVAYDQIPREERSTDEDVLRVAVLGEKRIIWKKLDGADRERRQIVALARKALPNDPLDRSAAVTPIWRRTASSPTPNSAPLCNSMNSSIANSVGREPAPASAAHWCCPGWSSRAPIKATLPIAAS
jgi:hypothetical protein